MEFYQLVITHNNNSLINLYLLSRKSVACGRLLSRRLQSRFVTERSRTTVVTYKKKPQNKIKNKIKKQRNEKKNRK
jgi:hypothetical protein